MNATTTPKSTAGRTGPPRRDFPSGSSTGWCNGGAAESNYALDGVTELLNVCGQYPADAHGVVRCVNSGGLTWHQQLRLALEIKLAFTLTATFTYEAVAAIACCTP